MFRAKFSRRQDKAVDKLAHKRCAYRFYLPPNFLAPARRAKQELVVLNAVQQKEMQEVIRDGISMDLTENEYSIINKMKKLNDFGQDKAIEQVDLLTKIPEYRKETE